MFMGIQARRKGTTMDKEFSRATEHYCSQLEQEITAAIPGAKLTNMGWLLVVRLENHSIFTVWPTSEGRADFAGEDAANRHWDVQGISYAEVLNCLRQASTLAPIGEKTSTAGVSPTAQRM
jgi:hypothetical protein